MNKLQPNPMLTLVHADCARCGATSDTVRLDRELLPVADSVCWEIAELIRLDPREAYADDDYYEPLGPEVACFYCGSLTRSPVGRGKRVFCSTACWSDYAE
jgi:hypothetical protein